MDGCDYRPSAESVVLWPRRSSAAVTTERPPASCQRAPRPVAYFPSISPAPTAVRGLGRAVLASVPGAQALTAGKVEARSRLPTRTIVQFPLFRFGGRAKARLPRPGDGRTAAPPVPCPAAAEWSPQPRRSTIRTPEPPRRSTPVHDRHQMILRGSAEGTLRRGRPVGRPRSTPATPDASAAAHRALPRREVLEHPLRPELGAPVGSPVDEHVVARAQVDREVALDRIPLVVRADQLVEILERP